MRALFLVAVLALAGCQAVPRSAVAAAGTSYAPAVLRLTAKAVGSVPVGGSSAAMERELRALLGPPSRVVDAGSCELAGPTDERNRVFSWKSLDVAVVSKPGVVETVSGWTVRGRDLPPRVVLPYGVTTRTKVRRAMSLISGAKSTYNDVFGLYQISTVKAPEMFWSGDRKDGSGLVTLITNHVQFCE